MPFLINGATASLAPSEQTWRDVQIGKNLAGRTLYYPRKEVILTFDSCDLTLFQQWAAVTSGGSISTLTMLSPDTSAFVAYSGVYLDFQQRPRIESLVAMGPWSILVREVIA